MKKILNKFLLTTLLISPATQVFGENTTAQKTLENNTVKKIVSEKAKSFVDENKNMLKLLASAGLLSFSAFTMHDISKDMINIYRSKEVSDILICSLFSGILMTTAMIPSVKALEMSLDTIKNSPEFLQKIERQIKKTKSNLTLLMKNNKKKSLAFLITYSALFAGVSLSNLYDGENKNAFVASVFAAISGKLAYDLATKK